jgi:wobble nucleotide-excising tRNase
MEKVWQSLAFLLQEEVAKFRDDDRVLADAIAKLEDGIKADRSTLNILKFELSQLSDRMGGSMEMVDKINRLLERSGFTGFTLREHVSIPDKYEVVRRDGSLAEGLSEGERHFIAFLYFYHLVQGAWKAADLMKGKIVVIDDPVSSMDNGVLFIVGSLVRELIEDCFKDGNRYNIRQIFVLTHNPYFHKEVSFSRMGDYKKVSFFEVKKGEDNISMIEECKRSCDNEEGEENFSPVQNSYTALWQEYRDAQLPTTLMSIICRIIDYHFIQLCSYTIDDLRERIMAHIGGDSGKRRIADAMLKAFYGPANMKETGDGLYFTADKDSESYRAVFQTLFNAMDQGAHYQKMAGIRRQNL